MREHRPSRMLPCEQCGKLRRRYYGGVDAKKKRHFCGRACTALANNTSVERRCEQCGAAFMAIRSDVDAGKGRFDTHACAVAWARENPQNERTVMLAGLSVSLREMADASGLSKSTIAARLARGYSPERALLDSKLPGRTADARQLSTKVRGARA